MSKSELKRVAVQNGRPMPATEADFERESLRTQLAAAEARMTHAEQCSTCFGTPHASGLICICGGTNSRQVETDMLRHAALASEARIARIREAWGSVERLFGPTLATEFADLRAAIEDE